MQQAGAVKESETAGANQSGLAAYIVIRIREQEQHSDLTIKLTRHAHAKRCTHQAEPNT